MRSGGLQGFQARQKASSQIGESQAQVEEFSKQLTGYEQQVSSADTQLQSYLRTDAGKLQYAKENNLSPSGSSTRSISTPTGSYSVKVYEYTTPYGKVQDLSKYYEQKAISGGGETTYQQKEFEKQAAVGSILGLSSPSALKSAGVTDITQIGNQISFNLPELKQTESIVNIPKVDFLGNIDRNTPNISVPQFTSSPITGMFALASAKDINIQPTSKENGLGLQSRAGTGIQLPVATGKSNNLSDGSILGRIGAGFKSILSPLPEQKNITYGKFTAFQSVSALPYQTRGTTSTSTTPAFTSANIGRQQSFTEFISGIPSEVGRITGEGTVAGLKALGVSPEITLPQKINIGSTSYPDFATTNYISSYNQYGQLINPTYTGKFGSQKQIENPLLTGARQTGQMIGEYGTIGLASLNPITDVLLMGSYATEGTKQALNPELSFGERIGGAGTALLSGGLLGLKAGKFAFEPIGKTITKPQTVNLAYDVIQPTSEGETGQFILFSKSFGGKQAITNRARDFFGLPPKKVIEIPSVTRYALSSRILTNEGEILNTPLIISGKFGSTSGKLSTLAGKQEVIDLSNIGSLSKTQQRTLQLLAEAKTGRPVAPQFVKGILGEDLITSRGILQSRDIYKFNIGKEVPSVKLFTGTTTQAESSILKEGLKPQGSLKEVYLTPSKESALGFANRKAIQSSLKGVKTTPIVLEANIPKSEFSKLFVRRATGIGGVEEATLKKVPAKYFKPLDNKGQKLTQIPLGKTRTIAEIGSTSELLATSPNAELYLTETSLKNVNKPFARASGNKNFITGLSVVKSAQVEEGATGKILKLKVNPKSVQTIRQAEVLAVKNFPKPNIPKINIPKSRLTSLAESLAIKSSVKSSVGLNTNIQTKQISSQLVKPITKQSLINNQEVKESGRTISETKPISNLTQPSALSQPSQEKEALKFNEVQISNLKSETKQTQEFKTTQSTKNEFVITSPKPTTTTSIIFKLSSKSKLKEILKSKIGKQGYRVKARKGGKILTIGENLPIGRALQLGARYVKSGTQQTFGIEKSGFTNLEDINYTPSARLFTIPKTQRARIGSLSFTERRGLTLTERPEVKGLQLARRNKGRKLFFK